MVRRKDIEPTEPDIITGAFSVRVLNAAPRALFDALTDLEVTRRDGTTALVVTRDGIVCLWLQDFLADEG